MNNILESFRLTYLNFNNFYTTTFFFLHISRHYIISEEIRLSLIIYFYMYSITQCILRPHI